jgi:hypothetical protein
MSKTETKKDSKTLSKKVEELITTIQTMKMELLKEKKIEKNLRQFSYAY